MLDAARSPLTITSSDPSHPTHLPPAMVFGTRLRQAREKVGISQEALATSAGIDEFSASARISQCETGKHSPRYEIACRLAEVLDVPVEFLYTRNDATAQMLTLWHHAALSARLEAIAVLKL